MATRVFNILCSIVLLLIFGLPILLIIIAIRLTSKGPAIHWSKRIGKNNEIFLMPKFRTMKIDTPQVATHLLTSSGKAESYITPVGSFLRKTSLDELPQIWSVLVGDMNLVGPRPALFNQDDLKALRTECGVHSLTPGVTGWAQINGRDEIAIPEKVKLDKEYLDRRNFWFDLKILFLTAYKVIARKDVSH